MIRLCLCTCLVDLSTRFSLFVMECIKIINDTEGALAIRRIFSLVDMITKPKFSNCPNIFKVGLFR